MYKFYWTFRIFAFSVFSDLSIYFLGMFPNSYLNHSVIADSIEYFSNFIWLAFLQTNKQTNKQTNLDFPDAAGRAPEKQFCFSPEGADSPYETYFPIACTTVPCLQPIGLAMVD